MTGDLCGSMRARVSSLRGGCKLLMQCTEGDACTCCGAGKPLPASLASRRYWSTTFPPSEWPAAYPTRSVHTCLRKCSFSLAHQGCPGNVNHLAACSDPLLATCTLSAERAC